jgi:hypothetical protein
VNHFPVEFPEFRQHLFLLILAQIFLGGIKETLVFLLDVPGIEFAKLPCQ